MIPRVLKPDVVMSALANGANANAVDFGGRTPDDDWRD
jgi:hypothetical protein